jgi:hypothetical protein
LLFSFQSGQAGVGPGLDEGLPRAEHCAPRKPNRPPRIRYRRRRGLAMFSRAMPSRWAGPCARPGMLQCRCGDFVPRVGLSTGRGKIVTGRAVQHTLKTRLLYIP